MSKHSFFYDYWQATDTCIPLKKDTSKQRWRPTHCQPLEGGNVDRKKYRENHHQSHAHFFAARPLFSLVFTDREPSTG